MKKSRTNRGITLIALIITIIVMMILVGVTVNVAINGGLFGTASTASKKTEMEAIYDQIVGAMKLNSNGNVNVEETYKAVVDIFGDDKVTSTNPTTVNEKTTEVTFKVTGKKETYTYRIAETEIKTEEIKDENHASEEEIVWAYIDWGDEYYSLLFVGNDTEIQLVEDEEVKAFVGKFNEDTEEYEYDNREVISVRLSQVEEIEMGESVEKLTVGQIAKKINIMPSYSNTWELVILGEFGDIPDEWCGDKNIENVVIEEGITTIGQKAFGKNPLISVTIPASVTTIGEYAFPNWNTRGDNIIYYGGTKEQWKEIEMDINTTFNSIKKDAKVVFADGTETLLFPTE